MTDPLGIHPESSMDTLPDLMDVYINGQFIIEITAMDDLELKSIDGYEEVVAALQRRREIADGKS